MLKFFANFSAVIYAFFTSRTTFVVLLIHLSFFIALIANEMIKSCRYFGSFSHSARRPTFFRSQLHTLLALNYCVCMCYFNFSIVSSPDSIFRVNELTLTKLSPWRLRQYVSPKLRHKFILHVERTSETVIWASTLTKFIHPEHRGRSSETSERTSFWERCIFPYTVCPCGFASDVLRNSHFLQLTGLMFLPL